MKKAKTKKTSHKKQPPPDLDLDPDAWGKFERLVKSAAEMGPRPHNQEGKRRNK